MMEQIRIDRADSLNFKAVCAAIVALTGLRRHDLLNVPRSINNTLYAGKYLGGNLSISAVEMPEEMQACVVYNPFASAHDTSAVERLAADLRAIMRAQP